MGLRGNDGIRVQDCVISYLCAVFDNSKFANDAILANFDVATDGSCFNDGVGPNMDVITNTHRIVIEVSFESLVRWSYYTPLANQTISSNGNDHGMSWSRPPQVSSDDGIGRDDSFASENDVLRTCDDSLSRDFIPSISLNKV